MALGLKYGHGPRQPLKLRPVGHTLLIHPKGEPDRRSRLFAERLAPDSTHDLVVIDLPPGSLDQEWETVAKLLADRPGGVRLVYGHGGRENVHGVGQRLADRLGRPVLAPDGEPLLTPGGQLFIPSEHGAGWLRFRPGRAVERDSRRFPKAHWEFSVPDSPREISPHGVAEPMPSGVWVRSTADRRQNTHRQRLMHVLPVHPDVLTVVIGSPGAPEVSLEDVVRFWDSVLPNARSLARFVHYGPVALADDRGLGQALADALEQRVVLYGGVPVQAGAGFGPPEIRAVRADGWLNGRPFITELAYRPGGDGEPAPPDLYGLRAPLAGLRELSYGVYEFAPDAVLEIVQSGLWVRPYEEPAGGDDVRRTRGEPGSPLILFDRGTAESAERMRSLAQDMLWRLEPEARETYRVAPADDPEAVRAAPREAVTDTLTEQQSWGVAEQELWDAAVAAAPSAAAPSAAAPSAAARPVASGTADRTAPRRTRTAAGSGRPGAGHRGAAPASPASPSGAGAAEASASADLDDLDDLDERDERDEREAGPADGPAGPERASRPVPPEVRTLLESGAGGPGAGAGTKDGRSGEPELGAGVRESDPHGSPVPPEVRALLESGAGGPGAGAGTEDGEADDPETGEADQDEKPRGRLLRRLSPRAPRLGRRSRTGGGSASAPSETEPRAESGPVGAGSAMDTEDGEGREAGSPVPPSAVPAETGASPAEPGPGARSEDGEGGGPAVGEADKAGGAGPGEPGKAAESGTGASGAADPKGAASEADEPADDSDKGGAASPVRETAGSEPAGTEPATDADAGGGPEVTEDEAGAAGRNGAAESPRTEPSAVSASRMSEADGSSGPAGAAGVSGTDAVGTDGADGTDGVSGTDGTDGADAQTQEPEVPPLPSAATPTGDGTPRPPRPVAPRIRLESGAPDVPDAPGPAPAGTDTPAGKPPVPGAPLSGPARPDAPEQATPGADAVAPAVPPGQEPPATTPAAAIPAVKVQPVPKAAACAVPPERGLEQERTWVRRSLSEQYNAVASTVSGVLAESPGLRGRAGTDTSDALTDLVAVRLYLFGDHRGLDAAVRRATVGPHVPLARCVASGLRRLPSYRGPALLHARLGEAERGWYREGRLATEWAFCSARTTPYTGPAGSADFLIWSLTARRTSLIDPDEPDRVLFLPGTSFKVLRVHTGERHAVLLRELSPSEIAEDGRVQSGRTPLDEMALKGLEQTLKVLTDTGSRGAPKAPAGSVGAPPGLILPPGGPKPSTTAGQAQRRKAAKK